MQTKRILFKSLGALMAIAMLLALIPMIPGQASSLDLENFTWGGWELIGNSLEEGIYGSNYGDGDLQDYDIYSVIFEYDSSLHDIVGTPAGFDDGHKILGIGVNKNDGEAFLTLYPDFDNNSYTPSSTTNTPGDGQTDEVTYGSTGDAFIVFPDDYGGQPSEIAIKAEGGSDPLYGWDSSLRYYLPCGNYGCGNGLPAIRGVIDDVNGHFMVFFDLTELPNQYGPEGELNADPALNPVGDELTLMIKFFGEGYVYGTASVVNIQIVPDEVWVDGDFDSSTPGWGVTHFATIQDGIDGVAEGGTVHVAAGTYIEEGQIVIDKDLIIIGEDKDNTIIKPAQNTGSDGDSRGWVLVEAGNEFNLSNVTLDGEGKQIFNAIRSHGTGTIDSNIIKNIRYSQYIGFGVVVYGEIIVSNNSLEHIQRVGISVYGGDANIIGNSYIGKGPGDYIDYGIEVGSGATAEIRFNTITNIGDSTTDWQSAAISVTHAFPAFYSETPVAVIEDNDLSNNHYGIYVGYGEGDPSVVTAKCNDLSETFRSIATAPDGILVPVDASPNWFGSILGPTDTQIISDDIDYVPWSGDAACTFFLPADEETLEAVDDHYNTVVNGMLYVPEPGVLENDTLNSVAPYTAMLLTDPDDLEGTLVWSETDDGSFSYTPPAYWVGYETFKYIACDAENLCSAPATVTIDTLVHAVDDAYQTPMNELLVVSESEGVLANDVGPAGETLTAEILTYVSYGSLSFMPNGGFSYFPPRDWRGEVTFTYRACGDDPNFCSLPATVTIAVGIRPELEYQIFLPLITN